MQNFSCLRRLRYLCVFFYFWTSSIGLSSDETNSVSAYLNQANWSTHAQLTTITQGIGKMNSNYSGANSITAQGEVDTSITSTIFLGRTLWSGSNLYVNPEIAGGSGLSLTHGIAGFTNGEIYRVDDPRPQFNLSRLYISQIFGFGGPKEQLENGINQVNQMVDQSRFTLILGKFALNDFLDLNSYSHDPRNQFMNWSLMDNGSWDYAADTRGYSWGYLLELNQRQWAIRFGMVLVPISANVMAMDTNLSQAHGDNLEFEYRYDIAGRAGKARFLSYMNHAFMGNYQTTLDTPNLGRDITKSRQYCTKYGFGLNLEQELTSDIGSFFRGGWNDGHTETWTFTEVDRTLSGGLAVSGHLWNRMSDRAGLAFILNGLSKNHADYLSAGGSGFILGDGQLKYAPEQIAEAYYVYQPFRLVSITGDIQFVNNPGYNQDRGPATVVSTRMHIEI